MKFNGMPCSHHGSISFRLFFRAKGLAGNEANHGESMNVAMEAPRLLPPSF